MKRRAAIILVAVMTIVCFCPVGTVFASGSYSFVSDDAGMLTDEQNGILSTISSWNSQVDFSFGITKVYADSDDDYYYSDDDYYSDSSCLKNIAIGLVVALVLALIFAKIANKGKVNQMNTAREQNNAHGYMKPGSFQLQMNQDVFLYSHVDRVEKPKNDDDN